MSDEKLRVIVHAGTGERRDEETSDAICYSDTPANLQSLANQFKASRGPNAEFYKRVAASLEEAIAEDAPVVISDEPPPEIPQP